MNCSYIMAAYPLLVSPYAEMKESWDLKGFSCRGMAASVGGRGLQSRGGTRNTRCVAVDSRSRGSEVYWERRESLVLDRNTRTVRSKSAKRKSE